MLRERDGYPVALSTESNSNLIQRWKRRGPRLNNTAFTAVETLELPPPIASYCLAMAHAAMFDAVNSIIGDYQPYVVAPVSAPPSARAAVAAHFTTEGGTIRFASAFG